MNTITSIAGMAVDAQLRGFTVNTAINPETYAIDTFAIIVDGQAIFAVITHRSQEDTHTVLVDNKFENDTYTFSEVLDFYAMILDSEKAVN